jgi:adenylate cyclase
MTIFDKIRTPQEMDLMVAFFDLTGFARFSRSRTDKEVFETFAEYYEFVGDLIDDSGGKIVQFIGDAALIVYPETHIDQGVLALKALQARGDVWLAEHNVPCRHIIKAHFGSAFCGQTGTRTDKRFNLFGQTVNTTATLNSNGFAITPQLFRKLEPSTRKLFKKHTPPITYIPIEAHHQD